jgi:serine/threonine protein kinase
MTWKERLQNLLLKASSRSTSKTTLDSAATTKSYTSGNSQRKEAIWQRRYKPIRYLGEGGMGRVLLAERRSDSVLVCLKFLKSTTDRRIGEQECRALLRLRHPAIAALLDFSLEDDPPWLASEYISGSTLDEYIKKHAPLRVDTTLAILKILLGAVDYAHGETVIHRDLKPANLIIDEAESAVRVHILDFGIAIVDQYDHEGRTTARGADLVGTVLYMAPEQLQAHLLTPACDLYAIGLMAWELLTGRAVFEGKTIPQIMFEKVNRSEGFTLEHGVCSPALATFIEASTRAGPGSRPTAREALAMLALD